MCKQKYLLYKKWFQLNSTQIFYNNKSTDLLRHKLNLNDIFLDEAVSFLRKRDCSFENNIRPLARFLNNSNRIVTIKNKKSGQKINDLEKNVKFNTENPFLENELSHSRLIRYSLSFTEFCDYLEIRLRYFLSQQKFPSFLEKQRLKHIFGSLSEHKRWNHITLLKDPTFCEMNATHSDMSSPWEPVVLLFEEMIKMCSLLRLCLIGKKNLDQQTNSVHSHSYWKNPSIFLLHFEKESSWSMVFLIRMFRPTSELWIDSIEKQFNKYYFSHTSIESLLNRHFLKFKWNSLFLDINTNIGRNVLFDSKKRDPLYFSKVIFVVSYVFSEEKLNSFVDSVTLKEFTSCSYMYLQKHLSSLRKDLLKKNEIFLDKSSFLIYLKNAGLLEESCLYFYMNLCVLRNILLENELQKHRVANHYSFLVSFISRKYALSNVSSDRLLFESMKGLYKAIDRFEVHKNCKFTTYAFWWVKQSVSKLMSQSKIKLPYKITILLKEISKSSKGIRNLRVTGYSDEIYHLLSDKNAYEALISLLSVCEDDFSKIRITTESLKHFRFIQNQMKMFSNKKRKNTFSEKKQIGQKENAFQKYFSSEKQKNLCMVTDGLYPFKENSYKNILNIFRTSN